MPRSLKDTVKLLCTHAGLSADSVSVAEAKTVPISMIFKSIWTFSVDKKDTYLPHGSSDDQIVLDENSLNDFERTSIEALQKDPNIKKPFCNSLEAKSAVDMFKLANQVNRISIRHGKGVCSCPDCHGTSKVFCPNCSGYGKILCPSCQGKIGGCSRCRRTGYVECPTCKGQKKIPCQKCKGKGSVEVDRQICIVARSFQTLSCDYGEEDKFDLIPKCCVDRVCYEEILKNLDFKLFDAEYKSEDSFEINFKADTTLSYAKFSVAGVSKVFDFWTVGAESDPLQIPNVLDYKLALIKSKLADAAVGKTMTNLSTKISLFKQMSSDKFMSKLLRGYEADFDSVTRNLILNTANTEAYTSKAAFTMKEKLESIIAKRKEELANLLSSKLTAQTRHLVSDPFALDCCMSLVEFISNLKYRPNRVSGMWNTATLILWGLSMLMSAFIPVATALLSCMVLGVISCFGISYFLSRSLMLYEVIKQSGTFGNVTKFIDINYDLMRALVMLFGILIIIVLVHILF
ncbi:MAG: hypothetical protein ACI4M9_00420 [Succinivibrio sp.]